MRLLPYEPTQACDVMRTGKAYGPFRLFGCNIPGPLIYQQGDWGIFGSASRLLANIARKDSIMRFSSVWIGVALCVVLAHSVNAAPPEPGNGVAQPPQGAAPAVAKPAEIPPEDVASADATTPAVEVEETPENRADPALLATDKVRVASLHAGLPDQVRRPPLPPISLKASIDLVTQRMTVEENGQVIHTWKISSGAAGYSTPSGRFKPQWRSRMWYSRQYDSAPMPYAVFFNGGIATHGTAAVHRLGRPASHGCVRLHTSNAKIFYNLVGKHGALATSIVVTGRARGSEPRVARRGDSRRERQQGRRSYRQAEQRGVRYIQTPYGYRVVYRAPSSRANRYYGGAY